MKKIAVLFLIVFSFSYGLDSSVVGKRFVDFTSIDEKGREVKASQVINGKPAVVVFFAIGDQPGTFKFLPHMNDLYEKYKDKVVFMAVLLSRSDPEEVKELKQMLPLKIPVYLGYSDAVKGYGIRKVDVPLILFIDRKGIIKHLVVRPESTMEEIYPEEKFEKKETIEERIKQSIQIMDRYIKEISKE
ncbi:TlpA disulfide reductase family protein [Persephonella sp.]